MKNTLDIYGGQDPRTLPAYPIAEAAQYLRLRASTLAGWFRGKDPLLSERRDEGLLSFLNLVEAFVLKGLREEHGLSTQGVRWAVWNLRQLYPEVSHPLAQLDLAVLNRDLYADRNAELVDASRGGQLAMRAVLDAYLTRVDRDLGGAMRLYPFTRSHNENAPRMVAIDPLISFGRPVIAGTSIPTSALHERWKAGDSIASLAEDYGRQIEEIEEAIRYEAA